MRIASATIFLLCVITLSSGAEQDPKYLLKNLDNYQKTKNFEKAYQTSVKIYKYYKKRGNTEKALAYIEKANQYKKEWEHSEDMKPQPVWIASIVIGLIVLLVIFVLLIIIRRYAKVSRLLQLQKQKIELQNTQLQRKNTKIEEVNTLVLQKKGTIEKANRDILDSMLYAKRIQSAMLTKIDNIKKSLPETFIYFNPRDIVSGDFYWFTNKSHRSIIAAIDCTGHGVPGALLSMIANELLNKIIVLKGYTEPDKILKQLHLEVHNTLRNTETEIPDGMDIAICAIHQVPKGLEELFGKPRIEFAGAKNSLIYIKNNNLKQIKGTMYHIGGFQFDEDLVFEKHTIEIDQAISMYMFSDGYLDQFGGENRKKFMIRRFKKLLLDIHKEKPQAQKQILTDTMQDWKRNYDQLDDMLIIGLRLDAE